MIKKDLKITDKIKEHLGFLDYDFKKHSDNVFIAKNEDTASPIFLIMPSEKNKIITFLSMTVGETSEFTKEMFEAINEFNKVSYFSSFFCDIDNLFGKGNITVFMKSTFEGDYEKETFSVFFDKLRKDHDIMIKSGLIKVFLK